MDLSNIKGNFDKKSFLTFATKNGPTLQGKEKREKKSPGKWNRENKEEKEEISKALPAQDKEKQTKRKKRKRKRTDNMFRSTFPLCLFFLISVH